MAISLDELFGTPDSSSENELDTLFSDEPQQALTPEKTNNDSEITKGFKSSIDNVQAMGGGLAALAGDAIGSDTLQDYGMEVYDRNRAEAGENQGRITDYRDIEGVEDTVDYILQAIGSAAPTALTMIGTGGVGGLIGKKLATRAVSNFLKERTGKEASEAAIKKFTQQAIKRASQKGQMGGAMAGSMGMETGSIYGEAAEEGAEGFKAIAASLGGGALAGGLDALPVMGVAKRFGFGGDFAKFTQERLSKQGLAKRVGEAAATTGGKEFATEIAQTGIEEVTKAYILDRELPDDVAQIMLNAGFTGMAGGGALGAVGGLKRVNAPQEQEKIDLLKGQPSKPKDSLDQLNTELDQTANEQNLLNDPNDPYAPENIDLPGNPDPYAPSNLPGDEPRSKVTPNADPFAPENLPGTIDPFAPDQLDDINNSLDQLNTPPEIANLAANPNAGLLDLPPNADELDIVSLRARQALQKTQRDTRKADAVSKREGEINLAVEMEELDQLLRAQSLQPNDKYARQEKAKSVVDGLVGQNDAGLTDLGQNDPINVTKNQARRSEIKSNRKDFKNKRAGETIANEKNEQLSKAQKLAREEKGSQYADSLVGDPNAALNEDSNSRYETLPKNTIGKKEQIDQLRRIQKNLRAQETTPESTQQLKKAQSIVNDLKRGKQLSNDAINNFLTDKETPNAQGKETKSESTTKENVPVETVQAEKAATKNLKGLDEVEGQPYNLETDDYVAPTTTRKDIEEDLATEVITQQEADKQIARLPESPSVVDNVTNGEMESLLREWGGGNGVVLTPQEGQTTEGNNIASGSKREATNSGKWWANQGLRFGDVKTLRKKLANGETKFNVGEQKVIEALKAYTNEDQGYTDTPSMPGMSEAQAKAFDADLDNGQYAPKLSESQKNNKRAPKLELTQETEADLKAADDKIKADRKAQKEADDKAKADAQVDDFNLTGSDLEADVAAGFGQGNLIDEMGTTQELNPSPTKKPTKSLNRIRFYFENDKGEPVSKTAKELYDDIKQRIDIVRTLRDCI